MSEFKFACPVCGQRMAADSSTSGMQIECPTCFQAIIVPKPASAELKYILSATQAIKPHLKPVPMAPAPPPVVRKKPVAPVVAVVLGIVVMAAVAFFLYPGRSLWKPTTANPPQSSSKTGRPSLWKLDLTGISVPKRTAAGRIRGEHFACERAVLQRGSLSLRQGPTTNNVAVTIYLFAPNIEKLEGQVVNVTTNDTGAPRVMLRWMRHEQPMTQTFMGGYALRLEFGKSTAAGIPGKIFLCLPDESRSFVAGTFNAEIRNPTPPRPHPPQPPIP